MSELQEKTIRNVPVARISPESTVNVRRSDIEENRDRLKDSIQRNGYHAEHPLLLRPHPEGDATPFDYEVVSGQSRFLAVRDLGFEYVPSVVEDLDDEQGHLRSFNENDKRGDLSAKDKIYWYEAKYRQLSKEHGKTAALEMTAEFYGTATQTLRTYLTMALLPESIQDDLTREAINQQTCKAIATRPWQYASNDSQKDEMMITAAEWWKSLDNAQRKQGTEAIKTAPPTARTADDFQQVLQQVLNQGTQSFDITVPTSMVEPLTRYARTKGFADPEHVIPVIISNALAQAGMEMSS